MPEVEAFGICNLKALRGVPITAQPKRIRLGNMRLRIQSLALLSGLRSDIAVSSGVGGRCGSALALLWLWCRLAADP